MQKTLSGIALLLLLCTGHIHAQRYRFPHHRINQYNSLDDLGRHEVRLSLGIFSTDQLAGIDERRHTGFDMPSTFSLADFLGYRYHLTNWFAIGIAGGIDYQRGNTTNYSKSSDNRKTGTYKRCAYTIASDYTFTFLDLSSFQMYGGIGVGYTFSNDTRIYDEDYYNLLLNRPNNTSVVRTKATHNEHINGQVTFLGLKGNGPAAFFFEVGYGYKGIINIGINARF